MIQSTNEYYAIEFMWQQTYTLWSVTDNEKKNLLKRISNLKTKQQNL